MRTIPTALAAHLAGGATTLCRCWKLTRRDGTILGFTDHDRTLVFDGVSFRAGSGLFASEAEAAAGLHVTGGEVSGALTAAEIREVDIEAGLYDDAEVATYLVNWADVAQRLLTDVASVGEIRRADRSFVAELRGPMHRLDQEQGRLYQRACSATLGDARCGVALSGLAIAVTVAEGTASSFRATALAGVGAGHYAGGILTIASGANAGLVREIRSNDPGGTIQLWTPLPHPLAVGDTASLTPGCDKAFGTCRDKFANVLNFRGFPHIPAPEFVLNYARSGEGGHDGGVLVP